MKRKISTWTSAKCSQFHVYYNFASGCIAAPNLITPSTNTKNQVRNNLQIKKTTKAMSTEKACVKDHRGLKIGGLLGEGFTRLEIREKGFGESSLSSGVWSLIRVVFHLRASLYYTCKCLLKCAEKKSLIQSVHSPSHLIWEKYWWNLLCTISHHDGGKGKEERETSVHNLEANTTPAKKDKTAWKKDQLDNSTTQLQ